MVYTSTYIGFAYFLKWPTEKNRTAPKLVFAETYIGSFLAA